MTVIKNKNIGPSFESECVAAGVWGLAFSIAEGAVLFARDISEDDRAKVQAVIDAHNPLKPLPTPKSTECFPAQGEVALYQTGHYDAYQAAVADSAYVPLKIYVQKASKWEITNPYIQAMQAELGLSDDQVQALFDLAVTL